MCCKVEKPLCNSKWKAYINKYWPNNIVQDILLQVVASMSSFEIIPSSREIQISFEIDIGTWLWKQKVMLINFYITSEMRTGMDRMNTSAINIKASLKVKSKMSY